MRFPILSRKRPRRAPIPGAGASPACPRRAAPGSPDKTSAAARRRSKPSSAQAAAGDFSHRRTAGSVYSGPTEWSYRRLILHYAKLCRLAGGVDAFLIGSELRGLTTLRSSAGELSRSSPRSSRSPPMCESILPGTKHLLCRRLDRIFRPSAGGRFGRRLLPSRSAVGHRPPSISSASTITCRSPTGATVPRISTSLPAIRSGDAPDYLEANIAGGEGFDWYYASGPGSRCADPHADHRRRLWQALGVPLQGSRHPGGAIRITTGRAASRAPSPPPGCRSRSRSASPSSAARRSTRAPTSPIASSIRNPPRAPCRLPRPAPATTSCSAAFSSTVLRLLERGGRAQSHLLRLWRTHGRSWPRLPLGLGCAAVPAFPRR